VAFIQEHGNDTLFKNGSDNQIGQVVSIYAPRGNSKASKRTADTKGEFRSRAELQVHRIIRFERWTTGKLHDCQIRFPITVKIRYGKVQPG